MSPSPPHYRQDERKYSNILEAEAATIGISVADLKKRRVWLGGLAEDVKYTKDPDQEQQGKPTQRQQRVLREHELLYTFRVFVENDAAEYDHAWQTPQMIVHREQPRHALQGYKQPFDPQSWQRHAQVAAEIAESGGPPPPQEMKPSSSASSKPSPPGTPRQSPRERSRSPHRHPRVLPMHAKVPPAQRPGIVGRLKRSKEEISPSPPEQAEPAAAPHRKRKRIFAPRRTTPPSLSPAPSN